RGPPRCPPCPRRCPRSGWGSPGVRLRGSTGSSCRGRSSVVAVGAAGTSGSLPRGLVQYRPQPSKWAPAPPGHEATAPSVAAGAFRGLCRTTGPPVVVLRRVPPAPARFVFGPPLGCEYATRSLQKGRDVEE